MSTIKTPFHKDLGTIKEFLQCTDVKCTDPASLQFSLQLAPGQYLYLESPYASYPAGVLQDNPVYCVLARYFGLPNIFIKDAQAGKLDHLLHTKDWKFGKITFSEIPEVIRTSVATTYGIEIQAFNNPEEYQQLICEAYFEQYHQ